MINQYKVALLHDRLVVLGPKIDGAERLKAKAWVDEYGDFFVRVEPSAEGEPYAKGTRDAAYGWAYEWRISSVQVPEKQSLFGRTKARLIDRGINYIEVAVQKADMEQPRGRILKPGAMKRKRPAIKNDADKMPDHAPKPIAPEPLQLDSAALMLDAAHIPLRDAINIVNEHKTVLGDQLELEIIQGSGRLRAYVEFGG